MADTPSGLDRADGLDGRPGTPTPDGAVMIQGNNGATGWTFEESPDSPTLERAEQATLIHKYITSWADAVTRCAGLGRGVVRTDSSGNVTRVLSSKVQHLPGEGATLEVVEEGINFDTPIDQFSCVPVDLGINIIKHPRYFYALQGSNATENDYNKDVIQALMHYMNDPSYPTRNSIPQLLYDSLGHENGEDGDGNLVFYAGTDLAKRAALEIIQKYWRSEDSPYAVAVEIRWSTFHWQPPRMNLGGYIEDPVAHVTTADNPQLPDYFWQDDSGKSIFSKVAEFNPQCYSDDGTASGSPSVSCLRKADQLYYERTWFRLDRIWVATFVGLWDAQLYNQGDRPSAPDDYLPFNPADTVQS